MAQSGAGRRTFVLIHGAWHGGWCYVRVADILRARGHCVYTPTLTGLGERSHLLSGAINLSTHIQDVINVIQWEGLHDVVLCGHSYAGMVITGVADRVSEKIASIVYLDAFVPETGQSLFDCVGPLVARQLEAAGANAGLFVPPVPAANFSVNERDREWVDAMCTPHPLGTLVEKLNLTGAHKSISRRLYVMAEHFANSPFRAYYEHCRGDRAWKTAVADCGHDVMIDRPEWLADLLEHAA